MANNCSNCNSENLKVTWLLKRLETWSHSCKRRRTRSPLYFPFLNATVTSLSGIKLQLSDVPFVWASGWSCFTVNQICCIYAFFSSSARLREMLSYTVVKGNIFSWKYVVPKSTKQNPFSPRIRFGTTFFVSAECYQVHIGKLSRNSLQKGIALPLVINLYIFMWPVNRASLFLSWRFISTPVCFFVFEIF